MVERLLNKIAKWLYRHGFALVSKENYEFFEGGLELAEQHMEELQQDRQRYLEVAAELDKCVCELQDRIAALERQSAAPLSDKQSPSFAELLNEYLNGGALNAGN